jgi:Virulence activator alpha C-term
MRFVMMEHLLPPEEVLTFLHDLADALSALVTQLEQYTIAEHTDRHPRLALDHGLAAHRASLRWAKHTIAALSAAPTP